MRKTMTKVAETTGVAAEARRTSRINPRIGTDNLRRKTIGNLITKNQIVHNPINRNLNVNGMIPNSRSPNPCISRKNIHGITARRIRFNPCRAAANINRWQETTT